MAVKHKDASPAGGEIHKTTFSILPLSHAENKSWKAVCEGNAKSTQNPKFLAQLHEQLVLLLIQNLDKKALQVRKKNKPKLLVLSRKISSINSPHHCHHIYHTPSYKNELGRLTFKKLTWKMNHVPYGHWHSLRTALQSMWKDSKLTIKDWFQQSVGTQGLQNSWIYNPTQRAKENTRMARRSRVGPLSSYFIVNRGCFILNHVLTCVGNGMFYLRPRVNMCLGKAAKVLLTKCDQSQN